ncbi:uncharacterized protein LOC119067180 [Bradysia coprophila]|uniref:uncharacterized protein LOC119067180 n=1 Tax=Bradysia coprophila TaxID=38358 RepID=UPI00187DB13F|nr:uncharacterized protein LOC119067180 [Bradysia coprophila]
MKKIMWHGVKNKYCRILAHIAKDEEPKEHICNRKYAGPSTGIESQLLLEAFENSEKNFGVRYHNLIADGDSKTYKIIDEAKIYRNPTLKIEKIECILHLYRCAMGLLWKVKNLISSEAERLLIGIKTAVKHWIGSVVTRFGSLTLI